MKTHPKKKLKRLKKIGFLLLFYTCLILNSCQSRNTRKIRFIIFDEKDLSFSVNGGDITIDSCAIRIYGNTFDATLIYRASTVFKNEPVTYWEMNEVNALSNKTNIFKRDALVPGVRYHVFLYGKDKDNNDLYFSRRSVFNGLTKDTIPSLQHG
jgi:hypothetical protein